MLTAHAHAELAILYEELNCKTASVQIDMFLILFPLKSMKSLDLILCWFSLYLSVCPKK